MKKRFSSVHILKYVMFLIVCVSCGLESPKAKLSASHSSKAKELAESYLNRRDPSLKKPDLEEEMEMKRQISALEFAVGQALTNGDIPETITKRVFCMSLMWAVDGPELAETQKVKFVDINNPTEEEQKKYFAAVIQDAKKQGWLTKTDEEMSLLAG